MSEQSGPEQPQPPPASAATTDASGRLWAHVRNHKVIQWGVAYLGVALAIAQALDLVSNAWGLPAAAERAVMLALLVGLPVALTLAWYHGHRGLKSISAGELSIISVLLLIGGLLFTVTMRTSGTSDATATSRAAADPAEEPAAAAAGTTQDALLDSVAVLPCLNQSPNADNAYIANGMHEEIILQLDKLENLTVLPRRAVMRYAESPLTIPAIASELRVEAIVDCTVRYASNRIRISAELINAASERLWSDVYERSFDDVLAIQADVAMNIANGIGAEYSPAEQAELERPVTTSPEAYRLYLQARSLITVQSPESIRQATLLFDRALDLDPDFSMARAAKIIAKVVGLVDAIGNRPLTFQPPSADRELRAEVERAIAIDPNIPVMSSKALLDLYTWRWTDSLDQYRAIADEAITTGDGLLQYVLLTGYLGYTDEGLRFAERVVQVDPAGGYQLLGWAQAYAQEFDAAMDSLQEAQSLLPTNPLASNWIAYIEIARGNEAAAEERLAFSRRILGDEVNITFWPEFAYAYHRVGQQAEAERFYREIVDVSARRSIGNGTWAMAYLAMGENEKALEQLGIVAEKARNHELDEGFFAVMNLTMNFTNDPLLKEPRFAEVLSRIRGD